MGQKNIGEELNQLRCYLQSLSNKLIEMAEEVRDTMVFEMYNNILTAQDVYQSTEKIISMVSVTEEAPKEFFHSHKEKVSGDSNE